MKPIVFLLPITLLIYCTSVKKENNQQDSVAYATDAIAVNPNLNTAFAAVPVFRTYSKKVLTDDERESAIIASLDSIFARYLKQAYFSIVSDGKSWHLDENKQLRIITAERENETVKENSIYLFNDGKLIAAYSDVDMNGMDTQRNRERIAVDKCPDCGVKFDLFSSQPTVTVLGESRVNELTAYFNKDYNEVLDWIAQAPIRATEGNNCRFERGSPNDARYTVNTELYNKFIKGKKHP